MLENVRLKIARDDLTYFATVYTVQLNFVIKN